MALMTYLSSYRCRYLFTYSIKAVSLTFRLCQHNGN
jgi:hypothetical protein